tara:strand:+ start:10413 stop:11348 length:936 start_codon:yes stop_codon:yes gene_type:complete
MSVKFANNAHSTLASSISTSATSITVASGQGARFPSLTGSEFFYATLIDTSNNLEIVKVTARSSDVLTVTRAQESTTARAFASGDRIELRVTAQGLVDLRTITADEIVNSMIATDAVNADSIAANAVGASEINVSGNGTSGQALLSDGDGTFSFGNITQNFVKRTCIGPNTTRYSHSSTSDSGNVWSGSFTKVHDDATSAIYLTWMAPSYGTNSDFSGVYFDIDTGTTHGTDGADAFYGVGYTDNGEQAMHWGLKKVDRSSLDAGTHNVIWGWRPRGGGSNRPGNVLNPNNGDDSRIQAKAFYCFVDEILK